MEYRVFLKKKAALFAFWIAVVLLIALLRITYLKTERMDNLDGEFTAGDNQLRLFDAVQNSEKDITFGSQAFSLSLQQELHDLVASGGVANSCGASGKINLWKSGDKECFPSSGEILESLEESSLKRMNDYYMHANPYSKPKDRYINNHKVSLINDGGMISANAYALTPVKQSILCSYGTPPSLVFDWVIFKGFLDLSFSVSSPFSSEQMGFCGRHYYYPSFKKMLDFNASYFDYAAEEARKLSDDVDACIVSGKSARVCVFELKGNYPLLSDDCRKLSDDVFTDFASEYEAIADMPEAGCTVFYVPPQKIDVDRESEFRIVIASEGEKTRIYENSLGLSHDIDVAGPFVVEGISENPYYPSSREVQLVLTYGSDGLLKNKELNLGAGSGYSIDWDIAGTIMFYKDKDGNTAFIDSDNYDDFLSAPSCRPLKKDVFEFCYRTGSSLIASKPGSRLRSLEEADIRFGLSFG